MTPSSPAQNVNFGFLKGLADVAVYFKDQKNKPIECDDPNKQNACPFVPTSSTSTQENTKKIGLAYKMRCFNMEPADANLIQIHDDLVKKIEYMRTGALQFIHGDIKLDNIVYDGNIPYLTDFDGVFGYNITSLMPEDDMKANDVFITPIFCSPIYMWYRHNLPTLNPNNDLCLSEDWFSVWERAMVLSGNGSALVLVRDTILGQVVKMIAGDSSEAPKTLPEYIIQLTNLFPDCALERLLSRSDYYSLGMSLLFAGKHGYGRNFDQVKLNQLGTQLLIYSLNIFETSLSGGGPLALSRSFATSSVSCKPRDLARTRICKLPSKKAIEPRRFQPTVVFPMSSFVNTTQYSLEESSAFPSWLTTPKQITSTQNIKLDGLVPDNINTQTVRVFSASPPIKADDFFFTNSVVRTPRL